MLIARLYSISGKSRCDLTMCKNSHLPSSINDAPGILGRCLEGLHAGTGWSYLVVMGGPHPLSNGEISVARFDITLYNSCQCSPADIRSATMPGQKALISANLIPTSRRSIWLISQNISKTSTVSPSLNLASSVD